MAQTINLPDELIDRIDRFAQRLGRNISRSHASTLLLDEALREDEFSHIEFRQTALGRQPFVRQTGVAVWELIMVAKRFALDPAQTSAHLQIPTEAVAAALQYYAAYPAEIEQALSENEIGEERLRKLFPNLRVFDVPAKQKQGENSPYAVAFAGG